MGFNNEQIQVLSKQYEVDFIQDVLLMEDDLIRFYLDVEHDSILDAPFHYLSGNIQSLNLSFEDINFSKLLSIYDDKNEVAEITGKNIHKDELYQKIIGFENEMTILVPIKNSNDERMWFNIYLKTVKRNHGKRSLVVGTIKNDRVYLETESELIYNSYKDPLTGLFNRKTCYRHIQKIHEDQNIYGVYIDLDKFKLINDSYGHQTGDEVLAKFGKFLMNYVQEQIIFYRLAGDEFFIQIGNRSKEEVKKIVTTIRDHVSTIRYGKNFPLHASFGVVHFDSKTMKNADLIQYADNAMYQSKHRGFNCITFITADGREFL